MSSLSDLVVNDDLDVSVDESTYQDQADPAPPLPGIYRFVPEKFVTKTRDGQPVMADGKYPTITIQTAKIVEGLDNERVVGIFYDINTKPFDRFGTVVTGLGDYTRAVDQTKSWRGLTEGLETLDEFLQSKAPFVAQGKWSAFDGDYIDAQLEKQGLTKATAKDKLGKEGYNALYKAATITKFKPNGKGGLIHVVTGPSGATLTARFQISRLYPSLETVQLGPLKIRG